MGSIALITELASSADNPVRVVFEPDKIVRPTREAANSVIKAGRIRKKTATKPVPA